MLTVGNGCQLAGQNLILPPFHWEMVLTLVIFWTLPRPWYGECQLWNESHATSTWPSGWSSGPRNFPCHWLTCCWMRTLCVVQHFALCRVYAQSPLLWCFARGRNPRCSFVLLQPSHFKSLVVYLLITQNWLELLKHECVCHCHCFWTWRRIQCLSRKGY